MPYTLGKVLAWFVLASVLGIGIGWIAHRVLGGSTLRSGRSKAPDRTTAASEVGDDSVVAERDRLRRELDEVRAASIAAIQTARSSAQPIWPEVDPTPASSSTPVDTGANEALRSERDRWRLLAHRHEATIGIQNATIERIQSHLDVALSDAMTSDPPSS